MVNRFKLSICFLVSFNIQVILSPTIAIAAVEIKTGRPVTENSLSGEQREAQLLELKAQQLTLQRLREIPGRLDVNLPDPAAGKLPLEPSNNQPAAPAPQITAASSGIAPGLSVPATQNLAELIGTKEISVSADADGQFAKNIAPSQIAGSEAARQVGDADLSGAISAGRSFSRETLASLARTEQAKAQTNQAFALLLPSLAVRASYGSETSRPSVEYDDNGELVESSSHMRTDYAITLRQPLFDLPSYRDWRRREVLEQARGENYRASDSDTYVSAVNAYLSLVSSRLQIDMTRTFENQLAELLTYIEKRASAGASSISDMARVRARNQATLSSRMEQESAHAAAGIEFVRLTNIVPQKVRIPLPEDVGASLLPPTFADAVRIAMKSNPEITALAAEVQAAGIDISSAKSRYLPRLDAELSESYTQGAGGDKSASGQKDTRAMLVLNWSLFNGGGDYNYAVERAARHKELEYRLDEQRRRVVQALSDNYATLATTRERISTGYRELKSISTAADAMSKRMLSGNQSLLDLLDVYSQFYQVRSRLLTLHILEMSTITQLVRLLQGTPGPTSANQTELQR